MAIGVLASLLVVGVALTRYLGKSTPGATVGAEPATTVPQVSATATPIVSLDPAVAIPPGARIRTPDEAIRYATDAVWSYLKAQHPHPVRVQLMTLKDALAAGQLLANGQVIDPMAGQDSTETSLAVWRIEFDGDQFLIPRCGPPPPGQTPQPCGSGPRAIYTFRADDGRRVEVALPGASPN